MMLSVQKRLAAGIFKCSPKRVVFDTEKLSEIKEAITKTDMRGLIEHGAIIMLPERGISRSRTRKAQDQKKKDHRKGHGSRKGKAGARTNSKTVWVNKVRLQRKYLQALRTKKIVDATQFFEIYRKIKGGFFRSKRHMELYLTERGIVKK
jgi:large subunit ribosomal protein L19e